MSVRNSIFILALAAAGLSSAHAQGTSTWVGGEVGFVDGLRIDHVEPREDDLQVAVVNL